MPALGIEPISSAILAMSISHRNIYYLDAGLGTKISEKGKGPKEKISKVIGVHFEKNSNSNA